MFIKEIGTLSQNRYNCKKPAFGTNLSKAEDLAKKSTDEINKTAQKVTQKLSDKEREAIRQAAFNSAPDFDTTNMDSFSTSF